MAKEEKKCESIPVPAEARQNIGALNMLIAGIRLGAGVPKHWVMNEDQTAFVPPKEK